jgi:hypothetical protein
MEGFKDAIATCCGIGGYANKATAVWNDCHAGRLANTALGGVERKEHPSGNEPPPSGVLLGGLSKYPRAGAGQGANRVSRYRFLGRGS